MLFVPSGAFRRSIKRFDGVDCGTEQAKDAEQRRDVRSVYQVVRSIAPKMLGGKVRIRSCEGALLTPEQEHAEILEYFRDLCSQHAHDVIPAPRLDPVLLTEAEILDWGGWVLDVQFLLVMLPPQLGASVGRYSVHL